MRSGVPELVAWGDKRFKEQMKDLLEFLYKVKDDPSYKRRKLVFSMRKPIPPEYRRDRNLINLGKVYDGWRSSQNPPFSLNNRCYVRYYEAQPEMSAFLDFIAGIDIPQTPPLEYPEGE
jgi:hypothetical protein